MVTNSLPATLGRVEIGGAFWGGLLALVRDTVIPYQWEALNDRVPGAEPSGCVSNFEVAAGLRRGEHQGFVFQDSDAYKWLEAAAYALEGRSDPALREKAGALVALIEKAQQPDGYLNTYFQIKAPEAKWSNLRQAHELYCAGHLIEAGVACVRVTGERALLDAAIRFADHICDVFGPEEGKLRGCPGHQEIELALVSLWRETGTERYLNLARFFISERGAEPFYFEEERRRARYHAVWKDSGAIDRRYMQAHLPPAEQRDAAGHAVRAVYMYAAMADIAACAGDAALARACEALYDDIVNRQMYITGGIGATRHGEAFMGAYELPEETAYTETCASIGLLFFCLRMFTLFRDGRYIDTLERALYNTVLSAMSLSGKEYFYVNPLRVYPDSCARDPDLSHVKPSRLPWFSCACCPPNIARALMQLGRFAYAAAGGGLYVNLYVSGSVVFVIDERDARVEVETEYPARGAAKVTAFGGGYTLYLRNPADAPVTALSVNGQARPVAAVKGYIPVPVSGGAVIELAFDGTPNILYPNPRVRHIAGKAAVRAGPVVYCAERADNAHAPHNYIIAPNAKISRVLIPPPLPGHFPALRIDARCAVDGGGALYSETPPELENAELTLIPYHLWGNRGAGEMSVYLRCLPQPASANNPVVPVIPASPSVPPSSGNRRAERGAGDAALRRRSPE
jgi:DUF1680 family protein